MPRWLCIALLAASVAAPLAPAEDLSRRLEELERETARSAPAPTAEPAALAPESIAAPTPGPAAGRLGEIQERRAREFRERAAKAARRAAIPEPSASPDPAVAAQMHADEHERDRYARKAEDVFRPGTADYQEAYEEWLASQGSSEAPAEPEAEPD